MPLKNTRQKGRAFVLKILERIKPELDMSAYEVSGSGAGLDKGDFRIPSIDLVGEAKDHKQISMATWVEQAKKEGLGHSRTAVFWKMPKSPSADPEIRVDMSLELFIEMGGRFKDPIMKEPTREFKWDLENLENAIKRVKKRIRPEV
ncbi:MAG TPA: hypothetical protein ENH85_02920 [Candidatus Scalindua sp.]|nr:hypothetical protein [Candidatus Scalindua sp.]